MSARKLRHSGRDLRNSIVYFIKLLNVASSSILIAGSAGFFYWWFSPVSGFMGTPFRFSALPSVRGGFETGS